MQEITSYAVGGLGNRLRPLASCYAISKTHNMKLSMTWLPRIRCLAQFGEVYKNKIDSITMAELLEKDEVSIYAFSDCIRKEKLRKNMDLCDLVDKFGYADIKRIKDIEKDKCNNIVVIHNDFLLGADRDGEQEFLKDILVPVDDVLEKISNEKTALGIDETVIGVHARGTDFPTPLKFYTDMVDKNINKGHKKFFVCSDSEEYEKQIKSKYGDMIITRDRKVFVNKHKGSMNWGDNVHTSTESIKDALVDLYLLSSTNFKVYNNNSTFAIIVNRLREIT